MSNDFSLLIRVRYSECDTQGVVFNARYGDYVDIAATEYFRVIFGGYQNILKAGFDNQVVNLTINWRSSAQFDDVLNIRVNTAKIGTSSFTLNMLISNHNTQQTVAEAQITYVMVDSKNYQKTPIPDMIKSKLENAGKGGVINQAG